MKPGPIGILFIWLCTMFFGLILSEGSQELHGHDMDIWGYAFAIFLSLTLYYLGRLTLWLCNPLLWLRVVVWLWDTFHA